MRVDVTMPNLGYDMEEGKVAAWLKQVGDAVERGEAIAEIETDKTTVEMEALATGTLVEIVQPGGSTVAVGAVIAVLETERLTVDGRLVEADGDARGDRSPHDQEQAGGAALLRLHRGSPRRGRRRSSPTEIEREPAERITTTVALVRACAAALRDEPRINSVWTDDGLLEADEINVGVAIALDGGLIAPALLGADRLDFRATAQALNDLVARARAQKLKPAELTDATFTLEQSRHVRRHRVHRDRDATAGRDPRDGTGRVDAWCRRREASRSRRS